MLQWFGEEENIQTDAWLAVSLQSECLGWKGGCVGRRGSGGSVWFSTSSVQVWGRGAGEEWWIKSPVCMKPRNILILLFFFLFLFFLLLLLLPYCDGCGAVLSALLSWPVGGLLLQGALLPRAGELLKSSSSSRPLVASYCVFSRRVIRRSSSSPNSPPIRVGSPTTITSWPDKSRAD